MDPEALNQTVIYPPTVDEIGIFVIALLGAMVLGLVCSGSQKLRRLLVLGIPAALFLLPMQHINLVPASTVSGTSYSFRFTSTDIAFAALAMSVLFSPTRLRVRELLIWLIPWGLLLIAGSLSSLVAEQPIYSGYEVLNFARGGVIFFVMVNAIRSAEDIFFYVRSMLLVLAWFVGNTGYHYFVHGVTSPWGGKLQGFLSNQKNVAALYLVLYLLAPLTLTLLLRGRRILRNASAVLLAGGMIALVLTDSRAGLAAFLIGGVFVVGMALYRFGNTPGMRRRLAILALCGVVGAIKFGPHVWERLNLGAEEASRTWRAESHEMGWKAWKSSPLVGIGVNNMSYWWGAHGGTDAEGRANFTHNTYLLVLAEMGPLGLLGLLTMFGMPMYAGWRAIRLAAPHSVGIVALALTGTLLVLSAHSLYEPFLKGVEFQYFYWQHAAVVVSCYLWAVEAKDRRRQGILQLAAQVRQRNRAEAALGGVSA